MEIFLKVLLIMIALAAAFWVYALDTAEEAPEDPHEFKKPQDLEPDPDNPDIWF